MSDEAAFRRLNTGFDWGLNELKKPVLAPREDELAETEKLRIAAAENGTDLAAAWLAAREKGDGSHLILELMLGLRGTGT